MSTTITSATDPAFLAQLRAELEDLRGLPVAAGLHPPWLVDSAKVTSAIMPDEDGIPRVGVY